MKDFTPRVRTRARAGVAIGACVVALLIAEVGLRLFWSNPYGPHSVRMIVELQTHTHGIDRRIDRSLIDSKRPIIAFRTNTRGYIEPAIRFARPDHTVLFLGGSTTECLFVDENLRFPARTSFLLEQKGIKINALNQGISGNDTHQAINNLFNYAVQDKPDVAVLMEAANDIGHLRALGDYQLQMGTSPSFPVLGRLIFTKASARSSILALTRHVYALMQNRRTLNDARTGRNRRLNERRAELPVEEFKQRLRAFIGISRAFGIRPIVMTQPSDAFRNGLTPDWVRQSDQALFNQAIRDVAAEHEADLIDLAAFVRTRAGSAGQSAEPIFYDGIHVTDFGSQLYAEHIAARLEQILQK